MPASQSTTNWVALLMSYYEAHMKLNSRYLTPLKPCSQTMRGRCRGHLERAVAAFVCLQSRSGTQACSNANPGHPFLPRLSFTQELHARAAEQEDPHLTQLSRQLLKIQSHVCRGPGCSLKEQVGWPRFKCCARCKRMWYCGVKCNPHSFFLIASSPPSSSSSLMPSFFFPPGQKQHWLGGHKDECVKPTRKMKHTGK